MLCIALVAGTASAAKTDTVLLANGNTITGKIKSLDFGALKYGTDSMGTVQITWEDVRAISSTQQLQIVTTSGARLLGSLTPSGRPNYVRIVTPTNQMDLASKDIVRILPIEDADSFWNRIDGDVSFGLNAQKASEVANVNLAVDLEYRTEKYLAGLAAFTSANSRDDAATVERRSLSLSYRRFRRNAWFTEWGAQWESNDEQGIDARVLAGGSIGRYLLRSNRSQLSLTGGIVATREALVGEETSETNAEGRFQARYQHRNNDPQSSFSVTTSVFPLLEDFSQFRSQTDLSFKREFIGDLFFEVILYHSYLSDPPTGAARSDYGATTSLGYSF